MSASAATPRSRRVRARARHGGAVIAANGLMAIVGVFMVLPFAWMLLSSIKPLDEIFAGTSLLPSSPTIDGYLVLFNEFNVGRAMLNSFLYALGATTVALFVSTAAGYAFAKFRFPGSNSLFGLIVASMALPFLVILVPLFLLMRNVFGWIDTPWPLILPAAAAAFGIFYMRQYMLAFPDEVVDAGRVDGASELGIFRRIVVPMSIPGMTSLGLIQFLASWNAFLWPLAVLHKPEMRTLPLLLTGLASKEQFRIPWDVLMAGSVVSVIPVILLMVVLRKRFVEGVTSGAVKG